MRTKAGVDLRTLSAEAWYAAHIADQVHRNIAGREVVITSANDGKHQVERSAHYRGDAIDVRIWYVPDPQAFADRLREDLGADYVVLLESDHIHIHWNPASAR